MKKLRFTIMALAVVAIVAVAGAAIAQSNRNNSTHLSGRFQVPVALDTQAQGEAIFQLNKEGTALEYKLNVANINNVFMAHIHYGAPNANGPIIVWLYPSAPPASPIPGRFDGVLAQGTITAANVIDPFPNDGQPFGFAELIAAMQAGNTYVNVHTNDFVDPPNTGPGDFPGGEIRGNIQ